MQSCSNVTNDSLSLSHKHHRSFFWSFEANQPPLVNNHCILLYEVFVWYKEKYGEGSRFVSYTDNFEVDGKVFCNDEELDCQVFEGIVACCNIINIPYFADFQYGHIIGTKILFDGKTS